MKQYEIIVSSPLISSIYRLVRETLHTFYKKIFREKITHTIHEIKRKRENTKHETRNMHSVKRPLEGNETRITTVCSVVFFGLKNLRKSI
jgi:hypothetical protein